MEQAEAYLWKAGFRQVRVRDDRGEARVEVGQEELPRLFEPTMRVHVDRALTVLGCASVTLVPEGYLRGSANKISR